MGIVPENLRTGGGDFIPTKEFFEGKRLIVESFEVIKAENPKYGASEDDYLCKEGKLEKGEAFRYTFYPVILGEKQDKIKAVETKSTAFFIAFADLNPEKGDDIWVYKEGNGDKTRYYAQPYQGQDTKKKPAKAKVEVEEEEELDF